MRRLAGGALPILCATIVVVQVAVAQDNGDRTRPSAASVTLDQLSTSNNARQSGDRAAELDVAQSARLPRAAAAASSEVSDRSEGRVLAIAPVAGTDRCDQASHADRSDLCRQRLEARADQYLRPTPAPVTPEGRLLLLINPNTAAAGTADGRQLGASSGMNAPNGPAEQLAGALRDQSAAQDAAQTKAAGTTPLPPIIIIPTK